jgi:DNA modification methylase
MKWQNEKRKLSDLKPATYNPRKISPKQKEDLTKSIERFDLADPIIINRDLTIIGGHQRYAILIEKHGNDGYEVDVRVPEKALSKAQEKELNIRLNRNLGEFDYDLLANFDEDFLKGIGFESVELDKIFQEEQKPEDDDVPEVEKTYIKTGDMFQLGDHRLLCGDCTKREDVERLMDGDKSDMVFTDPPYGVDYGKKNRFLNSFQKAGRNLKDIVNDQLGKDDLFNMLVKAFSLSREFGKDHCSYYVTAPQGGELGLMMMMMMMIASELPTRHVLIWKKNTQNFSLGRLNYEYQHEPILFTWKKTHKFYGMGEHKSSVWEVDKPRKSDLHPTMKPIALIENALLNSSARGDICFDGFGGSGSTLIACEKTNRKCRMIEIDPLYCQVIIKRWEDFTKQKASLINNNTVTE